MIPLFKSHYSISKSILTLDDPKDCERGGSDSIVQIALDNGLKEVYLVEDTMASWPIASKILEKYNIKLNFGVRLNFCNGYADEKDSIHKNIIFPKNYQGYKDFIKIFNIHSINRGRVSYSDLHQKWTKNLELVVPFYDSYIYHNHLANGICCPDFGDIEAKYIVERNDVSFDSVLESILPKGSDKFLAKSIYYKERKDFFAWQTYKLGNRKAGYTQPSLTRPNMEHCSSREFCWESFSEVSK